MLRSLFFPGQSGKKHALQSANITHSREDFASEDAGMINAKTQGRKGAKSPFRLGVFAVLYRKVAHFWQDFPNRFSE
jgi:hypothetical protein